MVIWCSQWDGNMAGVDGGMVTRLVLTMEMVVWMVLT